MEELVEFLRNIEMCPLELDELKTTRKEESICEEFCDNDICNNSVCVECWKSILENRDINEVVDVIVELYINKKKELLKGIKKLDSFIKKLENIEMQILKASDTNGLRG